MNIWIFKYFKYSKYSTFKLLGPSNSLDVASATESYKSFLAFAKNIRIDRFPWITHRSFPANSSAFGILLSHRAKLPYSQRSNIHMCNISTSILFSFFSLFAEIHLLTSYLYMIYRPDWPNTSTYLHTLSFHRKFTVPQVFPIAHSPQLIVGLFMKIAKPINKHACFSSFFFTAWFDSLKEPAPPPPRFSTLKFWILDGGKINYKYKAVTRS